VEFLPSSCGDFYTGADGELGICRVIEALVRGDERRGGSGEGERGCGDVGLLGRTPFRIPFIGEPAWQTLSFERSGYRPAVVGVRPDSTLLVLVRLELAAGRQEMPDVLEGEGPMTIRDGKGVLVSGAAMVFPAVQVGSPQWSTFRSPLVAS